MNRYPLITLALGCVLAPLAAQAPATRPVDLVLCLDTSNSMDGLIDAARQNLWSIVNDLALAEPRPRLRVALLSYGNTNLDAARGWVGVETPFTDDLDVVSLKLFGLSTQGGDEYVGRVLRAAVDELQWTSEPGALKLIIVAGNESAAQDPEVDFKAACSDAAGRGILVNSIYCGDPTDADAPGWREVAVRADGAFATIAKDGGTIVIETPFDAKLTELSARLNTTYVPYGAQGAWSLANQTAQDVNAAKVNPAAAAERGVCKGSANYSCASWDLVDALAQGTLKLEDVKAADLPEALRAKTPEELKAHLDAMATARAAIQKEIAGLRAQREAFVTAELRRRAGATDAAFEFAVRRAIRAQAEAQGFTFRPAAVPATPATATPATVAPATGSPGTQAPPAGGR